MTQMLYLSVLLQLVVVSVNEASYKFTVRFYEFRNPFGLQCGECKSGGSPACCDDVQRNENCINVRPLTCDTRFRFILRPFGASVETAPTEGFPHFTPSHAGNSDMFNEGPGGFLALPNPFIITDSTSEWTGRIQFFIDALDRVVPHRSDLEREAIINRFPIDLELELGAAFTARANYTGIYNISDMEFDMSFRVQCSENYYGLNCTTFCEPMKGVYTCDSEGRILCLQKRRNSTTNCTTCLLQFIGENCSGGGTESESDVALLAGTVGGAGAILIVILLILCVVIVVVVKMKKRGKHCNTTMKEETYDDVLTKNSQTLQLQMKAATVDTSNAHDRDFDNPLYAEPVGKDSAMIELKNGNQIQSSSTCTGPRCGVTVPMEYECPHNGQKQVDVLNPYYSEVGGKTDHGNASDSEQQNPVDDQGTRKYTVPYATEEKSSANSTANQISPHRYHNLCAAVPDAHGKSDTTITMTTHNEYDVIERCKTTSSTLPAVVPKPNDGALYSNDSMVQSKPVEEEMYNVAYPVLIPKADSSAASVDGYESLSNVY